VSGPRLRHVRVDPFATTDLARDEGLSAHEAWVLHLMAIHAEYRSAEWTGTLKDLSALTRCGRNTVAKVVTCLAAKGLIEEREPFRQHAEARVYVVVRDLIVPPRQSPNAPNGANDPEANRAPIAPHTRPIRAPIAPADAIDQGKQGSREVQRQRGRGEGESGACAECGGSIEGHPFDDHEPLCEAAEVEAPPPLSDDDFAAWSSAEATP